MGADKADLEQGLRQGDDSLPQKCRQLIYQTPGGPFEGMFSLLFREEKGGRSVFWHSWLKNTEQSYSLLAKPRSTPSIPTPGCPCYSTPGQEWGTPVKSPTPWGGRAGKRDGVWDLSLQHWNSQLPPSTTQGHSSPQFDSGVPILTGFVLQGLPS